MPQLEISNYLSQTITLIIVYIIYYYLFKSKLMPSILEKLYIRNKITSNSSKSTAESNKYYYYNI